MSDESRYPNVTTYTEQECRDRLDAALRQLEALGIDEDELRRRARVEWRSTAEEYALYDDIAVWRFLLGGGYDVIRHDAREVAR